MNYLDLAKQIAKEAGLMIKSHIDDKLAIEEKSSSLDIVTEIDKASEKLIRQRILEAYPDHKFLGEEESFLDQQAHNETLEQAKNIPFLWAVDPIDGTNNFVQRIPGFVVSIALICHGELMVGVIYDPLREEMFWAEKGQGAFMNGKKISVSDVERLEQSVVGTSFSSEPELGLKTIKSLEKILPQCRTARVLGSAALNLSYVAIGRLTAFWHFNLDVWDVAAGVLIIQEAGGTVTNIKGESYALSERSICTSNSNIHESLLENL